MDKVTRRSFVTTVGAVSLVPATAIGAKWAPMRCTETLKTRVSSEMKLQANAIADREFLSEAAWLKRLVIREIRARNDASDAESDFRFFELRDSSVSRT